MLGKPYPTDAVLDQAAKTASVDAGHRPNNWIFTSEYKRTFAEGYAEGRKKYLESR
jgi:hypothetical protein